VLDHLLQQGRFAAAPDALHQQGHRIRQYRGQIHSSWNRARHLAVPMAPGF